MTNYYSYIKTGDTYLDESSHATYKGITVKTIILLVLTAAVSIGTMLMLPTFLSEYFTGFYILLMISAFVGFVSVIIGRLSDTAAMPCSIIYSICEGLFLGTLTAMADVLVPGAGTLSVTATLIIFTVMLVLYSFGFIRNGSKMRMIMIGIFVSLLLLMMFDFIYIMATGMQSYALYFMIQAFLLIYGVITLTFNFAEAECVVKYGASKKAEWSVSLGILVSLIYIYIQILRIVILIAGRRR